MQIFEIWNNLFTKGIEIHFSFYHICFFFDLKKSKYWIHLSKFKNYLYKYLKLGMILLLFKKNDRYL
jgi:hypothetical protein